MSFQKFGFLCVLATCWLSAAEPVPGFVSLFDGKSFTGWKHGGNWVIEDGAFFRKKGGGSLTYTKALVPDDFELRFEWKVSKGCNSGVYYRPAQYEYQILDNVHSSYGEKASNDGRYVAINGRIVVTTPPEGRRVQQLWTTREFPKNFILKLEFRATPNADSGIFIRRPQLQCRDYILAGPWKDLKKYKPQQWNEIVAVVKDGVAHCTCNGEVLNAEFKVPPTGPIGLEGDSGQMEYRRIRVKELD